MSLLTIRQKFNPTKIGGCKLWLDASSLVLDGVADGGAVTTWRDLSGNGNSPTQATAGNKPTLQTGELNGRPTVRFDGTSDFMSGATLGTNTDITVVAAVRPTTSGVAGHQGLFQLGSLATRQVLITRRNAAGNRLSYWNPTDSWKESDLSLSVDTAYVLSWTIDEGSNLLIHANGAQRLSTAITLDAAAAEYHLATGAAGVEQWFTGDIAGLAVYNRALDAGDRARLERYLGRRYGIAVA